MISFSCANTEPSDQPAVTPLPIPLTVLTRAEFNRSGSEVFVKCEFTDYEEATCVVVFQHENDEILTVIEYDSNTIFPMSITVNENTTVFLFGKNGALESDPILTLRAYETHSEYDTGTNG